jgi:lysozyme
MSNIARQLRADEGVRAQAYQDHLGFWTIGVGRLIDPRKPGSGLRSAEIDMMLAGDIEDRVRALTVRLPWFTDLDEARQGVLINMAFQLGTDGLCAFTTTLAHVRAGRYDEAATAMLQSKWAGQTPARARRMAEQMRTGAWQFADGGR